MQATKAVRVSEAPSLLTVPDRWSSIQRESPSQLIPFLCFRPLLEGAPEMPICLVDDVLGRIKDSFNSALTGSMIPCRKGCVAAIELAAMANASERPDPEIQRRDIFSRIISILLDRPINSIGVGSYTTDGSILSSCMPIYHQEIKDEVDPISFFLFMAAGELSLISMQIGSSGDSYFQGQRYHQAFVSNLTDGDLKGSSCPALFIELIGPHLRISALASVRDIQVLCEPLTPFLHLFDMLAYDRQHMLRLACTLSSLKSAVDLLALSTLNKDGQQHEEPSLKRQRVSVSERFPRDRNPGLEVRAILTEYEIQIENLTLTLTLRSCLTHYGSTTVSLMSNA